MEILPIRTNIDLKCLCLEKIVGTIKIDVGTIGALDLDILVEEDTTTGNEGKEIKNMGLGHREKQKLRCLPL